MKRLAVRSKIVGTAALVLVLVALPLFAQSPVAPVQAPNSLTPPAAAPAPTPLAANPLPLPAGELPPLNLPTVAPQGATTDPSATPPASELPAIASSPGAQSPAADGVPPASPAVEDALPAPKTYSFGDSELSILFLPDQVSRMKESIRTFEDTGKDAEKPAPVVDVVAAPVAPEVIEDPLTYPVFYLSTIVYEGAGDWSLWLSGYKITSRRNFTDVTVLNVTRDSATFLWKPSFMKAITKREKDKLFASIDMVKHKLVPSQVVRLDPAAGSVVFTLKPNQSFAPGYFKTFEGYIDGPTLTALPVVVAAGAPGQPALGQPVVSQPGIEALDASRNPIDDGQNFNNGSNFAPPSTNFNPPTPQ